MSEEVIAMYRLRSIEIAQAYCSTNFEEMMILADRIFNKITTL